MESFREKTAEKKAVYRWKNGMGTEMCRTGTADPEDGAKSEDRTRSEDRTKSEDRNRTDDCVEYSICRWEKCIKAAGELASQKVMAEGVSIHAILPEQMQEEDVKHLTDTAGELCKKMNLEICQIQVETSSFVTQMVVTATAVGEKKSTAIREQEMTVAGQELLLCGYAGLEGTLRILDESEEELGTRFVPAFLEKAKLLREKLVLPDQILSVKEQVSDIRQIGSGGILAALWELGEELQTGFDIDFSKIALKQETVEICEFYQLNPYLMTSAGSFLLVTGQSEEVIACLAEQGVSAVRLGCMKDQNARVIKNGEETRYLDRPAADELARWWKEHA